MLRLAGDVGRRSGGTLAHWRPVPVVFYSDRRTMFGSSCDARYATGRLASTATTKKHAGAAMNVTANDGPNTSQVTAFQSAPSARRIPISCVRRVRLQDRTPHKPMNSMPRQLPRSPRGCVRPYVAHRRITRATRRRRLARKHSQNAIVISRSRMTRHRPLVQLDELWYSRSVLALWCHDSTLRHYASSFF